MKNLFFLILLAATGLTFQSFLVSPDYSCLFPIFDTPFTQAYALPKKWRSARESVSLIAPENTPNLEGLDRLKISGSGQFTEKGFIVMTHQIDAPHLLILDLRQESHGLINGEAVSWTDGETKYANVGKTLHEIEADEQQRLESAAQTGSIIVIEPDTDAQQLLVEQIKTERELVESHGYTYIRLPITDHNRPSNEMLDQFIQLVKELPADTWIHFHCKGGKGRTTTFMTLYDMMVNASEVSLEDILKRQLLIGGSDLTQIMDKPEFKKKPASERLELIKNFYVYCREVPNFEISWSEWVAAKTSFASNP